ncbi:hypothetical protein ABZ801_15985 [Actinomadura sp. NPDC047616]|uniref:hypothetical protein n=1 Tax=Actinomadura sp. NPDC047616 TaxID=3155914 RepID=UPI00340B6D7D
MPDRTVSARLRADVSGYIADMRAAAQATRNLGDEAERVGRRSSQAFEAQRSTSERLEESLRRLVEAQRRQAEEARRQSEETRRSSDETRRSSQENERNRQSQERQRRSTEQATRSMTAQGSALESLIGGAVAAGAAASAAGVAFSAFAGLAVPSIVKVVSAQENLAESWDSLSGHQRVSAGLVDDLVDEYKALARSYEPQALSAFNSVVATSRSLLPQLDTVVAATSGSVQGLINRVGAFATGPEVEQFMNFAAANAPQALNQLGQAATTTGSLALRLATDLTPVGMSLLTVANGALGLVNGLAHVNPAFAQLAVTGLLLRGPITGVVAGVGNMTRGLQQGAAATRGLSASQKALHLITRAGPNLYVAAGVGLAFLAIRAMNAKSATEKFNEALKIENRAFGNNLEGHRNYTRQLEVNARTIEQRIVQAHNGMSDAVRKSADPMREQSRVISELQQQYKENNAELERQRQTFQRVSDGATFLANKYSITRDQALSLATAAGVDLSTAMDRNGRLSNQAAAKIDQYRVAVDLARDPTRQVSLALEDVANNALSMKDRMNAATQAMEAFFNPSIAAYQATTQLKQGMRELVSALSANKGQIDGNSSASLRLQGQFAQQLQSVNQLWSATLRLTGSESKARGEVGRMLPVLYALAGRNRDARAQVDALARSTGNTVGITRTSRDAFMRAAEAMGVARGRAERLWKELNKIKDRKAEVDVTASGRFAKLRGLDEFYPRAKGGPIPDVPGGSRQYDSVPALLRVDEHVWTPEEVDAVGGHGAMYRLRAAARRGELQGYARGGRVSFARDKRKDSAVVGDVTYPIFSGITGMAADIAKVFAAAWKRMMSGGGVVAAARSQIGVPYSWGGGGKGGPSYGIGRGAGTVGFDCSGLTEYAWWRGRRVDIGGTTYSQYPNSTPTSRRPGALGFPHMGHVVLASNRPGYIIEAPYTGARVREVQSSRGYQWRWPKGAARRAEGGPITEVDRRIGRRFLDASGGAIVVEAKALEIAGDPGGLGIPGYASGGWVRGPAGRDRALIAATDGEYMINRAAAARSPDLVEAINDGRIGQAMIRPTIPASAAVSAGGGGVAGRSAAGGDVHLHVHNNGVIGSQIEMDNWLTGSLDRLRRQGRMPFAVK